MLGFERREEGVSIELEERRRVGGWVSVSGADDWRRRI